jgi:8-oxo-dGTP diphosphatase
MIFKIVVKGVIIKDNKLLIIKRSLHEKHDPGKISFPAGFVETAENPIDAVIREVKEETNLDVKVKKVTTVWTKIIPEENLQLIGINYLCFPLNEKIILNEELESYQWIDLNKDNDLPKEIIKEIEFLKEEKII